MCNGIKLEGELWCIWFNQQLQMKPRACEWRTLIYPRTQRCLKEKTLCSSVNTRTNCSLVQIERNNIFSNSVSQIVEFKVRIPQVTANLTGSTVSCLLVLKSSKSLQCKRKAHLTVIKRVNSGITQPAANVTTSVSETAGNSSSAYLAVSLAVTVVVVLSVVLLSLGIIVVLRREEIIMPL